MKKMTIAFEPNWKTDVYGYPTSLGVYRWSDGLDYLAVVFQTNFGQWEKKLSDLSPEQQMQVRKALMEDEEERHD